VDQRGAILPKLGIFLRKGDKGLSRET
jgi:hypothetical protein